ncbi:pentapeptide repeat-containing protein [Nostoc sp. NMS1]|uniref:pentapeptide repeat-containing protein n=1 Tax=unclassified Nostoc TaxID=2593658 RepID=UPI0025FBF750|nr:pentapeptide repeat-containing protein [Nostoc sp. NMS1]MBN3906742.1 pentapeptide repeat-containing protein [Nostoc sp. NMS1]
MANEDHLAILRQGVDVWNQWREKVFDVNINLNSANLSAMNLFMFNLNNICLNEADLSGTDLSESNLSKASLRKANLENANLSYAELDETDLRQAIFHKANLSKASLRKADLRRANLIEANLSKANLSKANLSEAYLLMANLNGSVLAGANLNRAMLNCANLIEADFNCATLHEANLFRTQALGTIFTTAELTGSCLEDWNINSFTKLDYINCHYIYLKSGQQERRPSNGNFAPGEFTKLFQKVQETVDLIFNNGIDWQAFLTSFQKLQVKCGGEELSIQAIENKNDGAFVIRVNVPTDANKAEVEKYLKREYELALVALEEKYQLQLQGKDEQIEIYRKQSTDLTEIVKLLAGRATYDLRNSQIGGSLINAETVNTDEIGGNIHNNNA